NGCRRTSPSMAEIPTGCSSGLTRRATVRWVCTSGILKFKDRRGLAYGVRYSCREIRYRMWLAKGRAVADRGLAQILWRAPARHAAKPVAPEALRARSAGLAALRPRRHGARDQQASEDAADLPETAEDAANNSMRQQSQHDRTFRDLNRRTLPSCLREPSWIPASAAI